MLDISKLIFVYNRSSAMMILRLVQPKLTNSFIKRNVSFFLFLLVRSYMSITPGSANLEILIK